jgi:hypothetical protein
VHKRPIEVLVGKKNLEVRPIAVNKVSPSAPTALRRAHG